MFHLQKIRALTEGLSGCFTCRRVGPSSIDSALDQLRLMQGGEDRGKEPGSAEACVKLRIMQGGEDKQKLTTSTEVHDELSPLKGGENKEKVTLLMALKA